MAAQLEHRHLRGVAGAGRGLLEQERHARARRAPARRVVARGQLEHPLVVVGPQVVHVEQIGHRSQSSRPVGAAVGAAGAGRHDPVQDGEGGVDLLVAHQQGRRHPDRVGTHRVDQQPRLERRRRDLLGRGRLELGGQQQPGPPDRHHAGQPGQPGPQARPGALGPPAHVLGLHHGQAWPAPRPWPAAARRTSSRGRRARRPRPPRPGPSRRRPASRCRAPWPW